MSPPHEGWPHRHLTDRVGDMRYGTQKRVLGWRALSAILSLVGLTIQACAEASAGPPVLEVTASESDGSYSFDLPEVVEAGPTRIHFTNDGGEPHHVQLFKLNDGVSVDEVAASLEAGPEAVLELGHFDGGTGLVAPGAESRADAVVDLSPGMYVVICFVPGPDGSPHLAHGMLRHLEVTGTSRAADPPVATHRVELLDYALSLPEEIPSDALLEVSNTATMEPHEMIVAPLPDNVTVDEVLAAIEQGDTLPVVPLGGVQAIMPGRTQQLQLDLDPGRYVIWCEIPSPDGASHAEKGMIRAVTAR